MLLCYISIISYYQHIILILNHIIILITNLNAILASGYKSIKNKRSRLSAVCPLLTSLLSITAIPDLAINDMVNVDCIKLELFDPILKLSEAGQTV